eukprot:TRINITY_DN27050_c0_g1_i3.p1 TRINITY_DN27050_c0_g1~~TRINITY_DN27050_c0_g1_i3.p1  ORF type:complete len:135 (+),score=35.99 TRINITY_DN27050_c0_g1_i3:24-428(+)
MKSSAIVLIIRTFFQTLDTYCIFFSSRIRLLTFYFFFFFLMIRRPPRSTLSSSSAASDVYKRQELARDFVDYPALKCTFSVDGTMVAVGHKNGGFTVLADDLDLSLIHISEPTRLLSISYAVFCLKKKKKHLYT